MREPPLASFYLYRVAHSALVDEIRRAAGGVRCPSTPRRMVRAPGTDDPADTRTPEAAARLNELGAAVRACLGGLKRERRLAVTLHLQGHSVPETARLLGWVVKRTENLVYRGLADLRQCLMAKGHRP